MRACEAPCGQGGGGMSLKSGLRSLPFRHGIPQLECERDPPRNSASVNETHPESVPV